MNEVLNQLFTQVAPRHTASLRNSLHFTKLPCEGVEADCRFHSQAYDDGYDGEYDDQSYDAYEDTYSSQTKRCVSTGETMACRSL